MFNLLINTNAQIRHNIMNKNFEKVCKCTDLNDQTVMAWLVQSISKTAET